MHKSVTVHVDLFVNIVMGANRDLVLAHVSARLPLTVRIRFVRTGNVVILAHVHAAVPLQVALVAGGVVADVADELLLAVVHGQVPLEQGLAAEAAAAVEAGVAVVVEDEGMLAERRLGAEQDSAALQQLGGQLVHGQHVALEVVAPVRRVAALRAREQLPAVAVLLERVRNGRDGRHQLLGAQLLALAVLCRRGVGSGLLRLTSRCRLLRRQRHRLSPSPLLLHSCCGCGNWVRKGWRAEGDGGIAESGSRVTQQGR